MSAVSDFQNLPKKIAGSTNDLLWNLLLRISELPDALSGLDVNSTVNIDTANFDTSGLATQATLAAVLAKLSGDPATQTTLASVLAKLSADPATQTTLAQVLAKLSADPATATKQDASKSTLDAILAKLIAAPATAANQIADNSLLTAILAKLIAAPATEAKQDTGNTSLAAIAGSVATAQRTPSIVRATSTGTSPLPAGKRKVTVVLSSDFYGTVLGDSFNGAVDSSFDLIAPDGDTLGAIAYTIINGFIRFIIVA